MAKVLRAKTDLEIAFITRIEAADAAIGALLQHTRFLKVEDFHDLAYIRERIQIMRREAEK